MTGSGRGGKRRNKLKKSKICVCLIVFGGLSLRVLHGDFIRGVTKKQDDFVGPVLFEALAGRFICCGESDVNPRHFQRVRIQGPGGE